jgi:signal transduction histidine kinase
VVAALVFDRRQAVTAYGLTCLLWAVIGFRWIDTSPLAIEALADRTVAANWLREVAVFAGISGGTMGAVVFMVTRLERALRRTEYLYQELVQANEEQTALMRERQQLEARQQHSRKLEALGSMAGGVAHDFNNLVHVIATNAELVRTSQDVREQQDGLDDILLASERAERLIGQLLTFSRFDLVEDTILDVGVEVEDAIVLVGPLLGRKIRLQTHLARGLSRVWGPGTAIQQIVMNLIVNARDAMPNGGSIELRTELAVRSLDGQDDVRYCLISVNDHGTGMDSETLRRAFDPFYTTKAVGSGTGLGLSLVKSLAEATGGFVEVVSSPDTGTTVGVYLRADEGLEGFAHSAVPPERARTQRLLVVDDDGIVRRHIRMVLERASFRVTECNSGDEALALLENDSQAFAAVVCDAMMPGGGGSDLYDSLIQRNPGIGFLVCSGYTSDSFGLGFFDEPNRTYLRKPFQPKELLDAVDSILGA